VPRSVAFLRALNLGSRRKVAMADLRAAFEELGFDDVSTYINSGNVLFSTTRRGRALERSIEEHLESALGFDVPTYVRTATQVRDLLAAEPFAVAPGETYQVGFLHQQPTTAVCRSVAALSTDTDELVIVGRDVHWRIAGKVMDSTLKAGKLDAALGAPTTMRNTTMLRKLADKLD
jgi:uncharacterized protein (DUF1697 family)